MKTQNEFQLAIAAMNGDFSVSTNDSLARALFRMGFCASTKRIFPSNIKGAASRYFIRISANGFQGAADKSDIALILFPEKGRREIAELKEGGMVIYDSSLQSTQPITGAIEQKKGSSKWYRPDLSYREVPFQELARDNFKNKRLRQIARNMIYVGILSVLLDLDYEKLEKVFIENFREKGEQIVRCNLEALEIGREYAVDNFEAEDYYSLNKNNNREEDLLMTGNDASALGTVMGGCTYASWYPITPATSHGENLERYSQKFPILVEQGENEDSCLGRALGAAWAGARASVSSSGPGISNMAEFIGYSSFTELPVVIFDVQRVGPATGLPTHTKQGDLRHLLHTSHDESPRVILTPSTVEDIFEYSYRAFDIADKYQLPVIVVTDLILGECFYGVKKLDYPETPVDRGKLLSKDELNEINDFKRYEDVNGDGVCYRTVPGQKAVYVTRGAYHDEEGVLSEDPEDCANKIERLFKKMETLKNSGELPAASVDNSPGNPGLVGFGSSVYSIQEARSQLADKGIKTGFFKLPSISPLPRQELADFFKAHSTVYVVEQNFTGQLLSIFKEKVGHYDLVSIRKYDGGLLKPRHIVEPLERGEI